MKKEMEGKEEIKELNVSDLEKVSNGGMGNVYVKKTTDITESMKERA